MITKILQKISLNQRGLTLAEIIATLVIIGILAGLIVPRFVDLETNASQKAIDFAISELNGREELTWTDQKISPSGYIDDAKVHNAIEYTLGSDYTWTPGEPTATGGTLNFRGVAVVLNRTESESNKPAEWKRTP